LAGRLATFKASGLDEEKAIQVLGAGHRNYLASKAGKPLAAAPLWNVNAQRLGQNEGLLKIQAAWAGLPAWIMSS
jgi:hypothetical protein